MPLPTGQISLSDIRSVTQGGVGSISMNSTLPRQLVGVSKTSGVAWSMSTARGKAWVVSVNNFGTNPGGSPTTTVSDVSTSNFTNGGAVYYSQQAFTKTTRTYGSGPTASSYAQYIFTGMNDKGGGFTSTPSETIATNYIYPTGYQIETIYGNLS